MKNGAACWAVRDTYPVPHQQQLTCGIRNVVRECQVLIHCYTSHVILPVSNSHSFNQCADTMATAMIQGQAQTNRDP